MRNMDTLVRSLVSAAALTLLIFRLGLIHSDVDAVNVGLALIAVLPWVSWLVESAVFARRWEAQFREMQVEQEKQKDELAKLRFLTAYHVTEHERDYLKKLAHGESFVYAPESMPTYFDTELRRLLTSGLIDAVPGKGIDSLLRDAGEVSDHFCITERGRAYVKLREELESDGQQQADSPE
jgi:hypothetical protein